MSILSFFKRDKEFFTVEEKQKIVNTVCESEKMTSGEIRIFVESRCSYVDAIDRATELFYKLEMDKTRERNGVLLYVAMTDRQLAVFGDEGIHNKVGSEYWNKEVKKMISRFNKNDYAAGICEVITDIGEALTQYFPYNNDTDKNELPDEIVFGK